MSELDRRIALMEKQRPGTGNGKETAGHRDVPPATRHSTPTPSSSAHKESEDVPTDRPSVCADTLFTALDPAPGSPDTTPPTGHPSARPGREAAGEGAAGKARSQEARRNSLQPVDPAAPSLQPPCSCVSCCRADPSPRGPGLSVRQLPRAAPGDSQWAPRCAGQWPEAVALDEEAKL